MPLVISINLALICIVILAYCLPVTSFLNALLKQLADVFIQRLPRSFQIFGPHSSWCQSFHSADNGFSHHLRNDNVFMDLELIDG